MALRVYSNPMALDFIIVSHQATADQIEQWEAMTGHAWDHESCALGMIQTNGPKWVIKTLDHRPIAVAGYHQERPGVFRDFLISNEEAWADGNWQALTRHARKAMNAMLNNGAHRLECVSLSSRTKAHRWYAALGMKAEGTLHGYCASGEDAIMFARVRG